jgi:hypothetical protein
MRGFQGRFLAVLAGSTILLALLLGLTAEAADKKAKPKPAVVEIQGLKVAVDGTKIDIDGVVHNSGERTIEKLVLSFHFFDSDHQPVTTLKLEIDDETIDPGEDAEIHAAANEPPRAISMEVTAADRGEKDLKVVNPGPYRIE